MGTLYPGKMRPGLDRCAGHFLDGIYIRKVQCLDGALVICDVEDRELHREHTGLLQFTARSIGCIRSAQTGKLVVVLGGYTAGTSGQVAHVYASDYPIQPPQVFQG